MEAKVSHATFGTITTELDLNPDLSTSIPGGTWASHSPSFTSVCLTVQCWRGRGQLPLVPRAYVTSSHMQ